MDWAQLLVIILAVLFAIFLIIAIILAVLVMRLTLQMKKMATSAERTIHSLEDSVVAFRKTAVPLMIAKGVMARVRGPRQKKPAADE